MEAIGKLEAVSRSFGKEAAGAKLRLLEEIAAAKRLGARQQRRLADTLDFMRAYPDSAAVRDRVRDLVERLPETDNVYEYSYAVLLRLVRLFPGRLEIEWEEVDNEQQILDVFDLLIQQGEVQGLEDVSVSLTDWIDGSKPAGKTDLEYILDLFERSSLPPPARVYLFESCNISVRYRGPGRCALALPAKRIHYQRHDVERTRFPLEPVIRKPVGRFERAGQGVVDLALQALCARSLEIFPLIYANPADVVLADCGRGLRIALVGVLPEWRSALESLVFFLVFKNGVPVAYGPASAFLGCCEMGINLFPEFRGGEIRHIYAQFMRVLHHHLGVDYFFLTHYGMGVNNPDAIKSGAFWFYRKLGFRPTNPEVEELAQAEEKRMLARPGYRSDRRMLRRLSRTQAYFDLSDGKCRPFEFGSFGIALSRHIAARYDGDRAIAESRCARRIGRLLGASAGRSLLNLAPALDMIPDLPDWTPNEKSVLARILREKDARSEARAARLFKRHARLEAALRAMD